MNTCIVIIFSFICLVVHATPVPQSTMMERAQETFDKMKEKVQQALDNGQEAANRAIESAQTKMREAMESAQQAAKQAIEVGEEWIERSKTQTGISTNSTMNSILED